MNTVFLSQTGNTLDGEFFLLLATVIVAVGVVILYYNLRRLEKRSHTTMKSITRLLRRTGRIRSWQVAEDVKLVDRKGEGCADQVVVGPFGVLMLRDLHRQGTHYGDKAAPEWVITDGAENVAARFRDKIPNPLLECQRAADVFKRQLIDHHLGSVQIHVLVVRTQQKAEVYMPGGSDQVLTKAQLKSILDQERFTKDRGVDVGKVMQVLQDSREQ